MRIWFVRQFFEQGLCFIPKSECFLRIESVTLVLALIGESSACEKQLRSGVLSSVRSRLLDAPSPPGTDECS
jgi:hypothetical protein